MISLNLMFFVTLLIQIELIFFKLAHFKIASYLLWNEYKWKNKAEMHSELEKEFNVKITKELMKEVSLVYFEFKKELSNYNESQNPLSPISDQDEDDESSSIPMVFNSNVSD